jgi:hypothetical protein
MASTASKKENPRWVLENYEQYELIEPAECEIIQALALMQGFISLPRSPAQYAGRHIHAAQPLGPAVLWHLCRALTKTTDAGGPAQAICRQPRARRTRGKEYRDRHSPDEPRT